MPRPENRHAAARPTAPRPDDAHGPPGQLPRSEALVGDRAIAVDLAFADVAVGGEEMAGDGEQQRHRDLGDAVGVPAGGAQHGDPGCRGARDVDVGGVAPGRADGHEREVEHRALHLVGLADDDGGALGLDAGCEIGRR